MELNETALRIALMEASRFWHVTRAALRFGALLRPTCTDPARGFVTDRGMEPDRRQRALDVVVVVALLMKDEGKAPGSPTRLGVRRLPEPYLREPSVLPLERHWQPTELATRDRREVASHRDRRREGVRAGHLELFEPSEGPQDR